MPNKYTVAERRAMRKAVEEMRDEGFRVVPKRPKQSARRKAERAAKPKRKCTGLNARGEPCGMPPLKPGTVIEDVKVSGQWCLRHDQDLPADYWTRWAQKAGQASVAARTIVPVSPYALLGKAVAENPSLLLGAQLDALGKRINPETFQVEDKLRADGTPDLGATFVGFSREGAAKKSKIRDHSLQARIEQQLADRLYGKPKMAVSLDGDYSISMPQIPQTIARATEVAQILAENGALASVGGGAADDLPEKDDPRDPEQ